MRGGVHKRNAGACDPLKGDSSWPFTGRHAGKKEQLFIQGPYGVVMVYLKSSAVRQLSSVYCGTEKDPLKDEHKFSLHTSFMCVLVPLGLEYINVVDRTFAWATLSAWV